VVDHLFRHQSGRLVSTLTRIFGPRRLDLAEEVVQDALLKALELWPFQGIPANPSAWLIQVAKKSSITPRWRITICCQPRWANYPANWAIKKRAAARITNRHWSAHAPSPNAACSKNTWHKTYTEYRGARTRACRVHTRVNARSQDEINLALSILTTACTLHAADAALTPAERAHAIQLLQDSQKEFLALVDGLTDAQWTYKSAPDRWSVGETAEHIMLGEALLFASVQRAVDSPPNPDWEPKRAAKRSFWKR